MANRSKTLRSCADPLPLNTVEDVGFRYISICFWRKGQLKERERERQQPCMKPVTAMNISGRRWGDGHLMMTACHLFTAAALLAQLDRDGALITWSQALHSIHPQQCRSLMVVTVSSVFLSDDQMKYYWQLCTRTHAHKGMWSWPPHTARGHIRINYFMEVPA